MPSLVAVAVTVTVDDRPFTLSARVSGDSVAETIAVPLTGSDIASSVLVLAASAPHAFTTVAHDAASELGVGAAIEHNRHLHLFVDVHDARTQSNLSHRSTVDRAIGILLDRGPADSPAAAHIWLKNAAARSNRTVVEVAQDTVDSVRRHHELHNDESAS